MGNQEQLSEHMQSIQKIKTQKNDSANYFNGTQWQAGREINRGGAPTPDSIEKRGEENGGFGSYSGDPFEQRPKAVYLAIEGDLYEGTSRPSKLEGIYDYRTMLQLFATQ